MSDKLAAWEVQEADFPIAGTTSDQLKFILNYAVLAPSGPNTQPWKLALKENEVSLIANFLRSLPSVDPTDRTLFISHGCLLANILLAAKLRREMAQILKAKYHQILIRMGMLSQLSTRPEGL